MNNSEILSMIDTEILRLSQVRAILLGSSVRRKVGRPRKVDALPVVAKTRKPLSAEAKARIAEAQRKRWAKTRNAANRRQQKPKAGS